NSCLVTVHPPSSRFARANLTANPDESRPGSAFQSGFFPEQAGCSRVFWVCKRAFGRCAGGEVALAGQSTAGNEGDKELGVVAGARLWASATASSRSTVLPSCPTATH